MPGVNLSSSLPRQAGSRIGKATQAHRREPWSSCRLSTPPTLKYTPLLSPCLLYFPSEAQRFLMAETTELSREQRDPRILESPRSGPAVRINHEMDTICARSRGLTEEVQLLISLQGFFSGEREVEPA